MDMKKWRHYNLQKRAYMRVQHFIGRPENAQLLVKLKRYARWENRSYASNLTLSCGSVSLGIYVWVCTEDWVKFFNSHCRVLKVAKLSNGKFKVYEKV